MSDLTITVDELLAELERSECAEDSGVGFTTSSLAERWEMSEKRALKLVKVGLASGKLRLGRKQVTTIIGVRRSAPCWIPVSPK